MNVFVFSYLFEVVIPTLTHVDFCVFGIGIVHSFFSHSAIATDQMTNIEISVYGIASYKDMVGVCADIDVASAFAIANH
jgi:hypothetical protein